ncbi:endonuclease Q family protein, partial [archaeon]|nr:endonuclease Q family protein [archaeon]
MLLDCDFHIHSRYSQATSKNMTLENISVQAPRKGLHLMGTGDALHPAWLSDIEKLKEFSEGIYEKNNFKFIITTEVEDARRVHHLIFLPSVSAAKGLSESLKKHSKDLAADGRPKL